MKKIFLISIDTEGDNLWSWDRKKAITTKNVFYLKRFQQLCDKYGFKPTYLSNYEMVSDDSFVEFIKSTLLHNGCEVGMHLHAWNSLPLYDLKERNDGVESGLSYITEYPTEVIDKKVEYLTNLIKERIGVAPVTHRAGRWATNEEYARILEKYGYKYDCSFTPHKSWKSNAGFTNDSYGNDYSNEKNKIGSFYNTSIIEIPLQSYKNKRIKKENIKDLKSFVKNVYYAFRRNQYIELRPNKNNLNDLLYIVDKNYKTNQKYLMFMLHSSEFMPGGSPNFETEEDIEKLFNDLDTLFNKISKLYIGMTIGEFGDSLKNVR